ncbi:rod shape-determining protein [Candidatus Hydrogenosomobacter endosymbioticus]|uniref:rod shape-determining protein n=1 Tax=Candidatus Hydrogenosomobacter endosymbioticus TaxID=2558174 RepID=UPI0030138677
MFGKIIGLFSSDMAIDLGTANTLIYVRGEGIVLNEPSVVAVSNKGVSKQVIAVGNEAKGMLGRTPSTISVIRPMKDGVIADFEIAEEMIKHFIQKVHNRRSFISPRIVICVPSGATAVEKRAINDAGLRAGARNVYLIEEPMAAAIGAGLPVTDASGSMVVDIGGGTTEIALISLGGIVSVSSIRVGGDKFDETIVASVKKEYGLFIGDIAAEEAKKALVSVYYSEKGYDEGVEKQEIVMRGRDLISGTPKEMSVKATKIVDSLKEPLNSIIDSIKATLEKSPPELSSDIVRSGIMLTGGGAFINGFDRLISVATGLEVNVAKDPLLCVAVGTGMVLEKLSELKDSVLAAI